MRKRRRSNKRIVRNISIIYIAAILSLSFMGVGYAAWSSGLNLDIDITTGYIQGRIKEINNGDLDLDDGEWISFEYSDDKQILYIDGEVYPDYNGNIPIKILDEGSIPVMLKDVDPVNDAEITKLKEEVRNKYSRRLFDEEEAIESFELNINPDNDRKNNGNDNNRMQRYSLEDKDEISNLQDRIDEYNTEEDYEFLYELLLEQAL